MASPWSCFHRRFHSPSAQARFGPVRFARYWFSWMDGCCPPYVSMEPMWLVRGCVRRTDGVCSGPKGRLRHARLAAAAVLLSLGAEVIEVTLKGRGAFRRAWEEKWETSITTWSCAASIRWLATWQHQTPAPPWHGPLEVALRSGSARHTATRKPRNQHQTCDTGSAVTIPFPQNMSHLRGQGSPLKLPAPPFPFCCLACCVRSIDLSRGVLHTQ